MRASSDQRSGRGSVSRRSFLKGSAVAAGSAIGFPYIIPSSALGADGATAPSNRIVMGCIGVGSQGTGNMRGFLGIRDCQVVAVCDVDRAHRERARDLVNAAYENQDCADYTDFRELLDRPDLDAVSLALPDHWHSIPAIAAAKRGLHMYAEKPLALTIAQGRAMVDAVHRYGVVWQTGSWQRSNENFRRGAELVRNGYIGEVHTVKVGLPTGKGIAPQPVMPIPDGFDFDMWLGPAPQAEYTKERCHWNFRWIFDYSGGQLTDWAAHHCDIANWGMGTEETGPMEISGKGEFPEDGLWNTAIHYMVECKYAPGASPVAPNGFTMLVSDSFPMGTRFEGTEGFVFTDRGDVLETGPESLKDKEVGEDEIQLYRSRNHARNFLDCARELKPTAAPIHAAHHAINIAHLGNISMRLQRPVRWNPDTERFVDDPQADRFLDRAMRGSWHI